ncbi:MAG: hypothetical protein AAGG38_09235 [Planctomycetota bacterium]
MPTTTPPKVKPTPKKAGRPRGRRAAPAPIVEAELSRCPACGSTQRDRYLSHRESAFGGTRPDGTPYTHVVWRRCKCSACGQVRTDKTYEHRPAAPQI